MDINQLDTEQRNPQSTAIEDMSIADITAYINREDCLVPLAVEKALPQINKVISLVVQALSNGGRLIYIGAGTSGRLGILDASECPPTYGVDSELVQGLIAGGDIAIRQAQEGAEDDEAAAVENLKKITFSSKDVLIGLAASGRTPYVRSALCYAKELGAKTAAISCVKNALISSLVTVPVEILVGPEVITGSSRMKAGTAQKMVLNLISTTTMVQLGKVYKGYMVDVQPTNEKLVARAKYIIQQTTSCSSQEASKVFEASKRQVKHAILMELGQLSLTEADRMLEEAKGNVVLAIKTLSNRRE